MGIRSPKVPLVAALMRAATPVAGSAEAEGGKVNWKQAPVAYACRSAHMNRQPYEIELLKKASQIPDDLWDACFQPPTEGRWWYEALEQSGIDDQFIFFMA